MNCPSRTDEPARSDGHNQNPNALSNDLTTNQDLNGMANARRLRRTASLPLQSAGLADDAAAATGVMMESTDEGAGPSAGVVAGDRMSVAEAPAPAPVSPQLGSSTEKEPARSRVQAEGLDGGGRGEDREGVERQDLTPNNIKHRGISGFFRRVGKTLVTFYRFVGPGFIVAVAYIDPGNYSTDIAAGASYRFRLLFIVLLSNLFAIFLQSLAIKLGTVTGRNLAEACRAFLPCWLNVTLYVLAEIAIIATDIAEVIGTAIALNLLQPKIPLVAGCAISIVDVFVVLFFCRPADEGEQSKKGTANQQPRQHVRRGMRAFELLVAALVLAVVVCFCIQLSLVHRSTTGTTAAKVLRGYLPSSALVQPKAIYQACGILGATVMPHSIYLGSGIVQARLRVFDAQHGLLPDMPGTRDVDDLALSLFTFALFVNSAILVVAGASLYGNAAAQDADIFAIHDLLAHSIAPAAGTVFALALLFSGLSAGVVCTVAGQMVSEGALRWTVAPWLRRLLTRSISIMPSIVIAGAVGRNGLDTALNATQVALSIILPFVTAPLLWFTCSNRYMTVQPGRARFLLDESRRRQKLRAAAAATATAASGIVENTGTAAVAQLEPGDGVEQPVKMANSWPVALLGLAIWLIMAAMNVANLVLLRSA
ncbi:transporter protein smf2 [Grosmannia clavigera kw1407]|uniref:Transporter protein smf2 n=1 Tax=Grosmannia clavigera (strain kw1407 / UAMH 11150) TaxID=655863 RepID=F0XLE6_GROCL|nr:transporter protein smf2 [Grosmannia clavigera kw1407]EFX01236.1 transporter protein smf2 [Grosmannia clavigera kw1407]